MSRWSWANDHGGLHLREAASSWATGHGIAWIDRGHAVDGPSDYVPVAARAAHDVFCASAAAAVMVCRDGHGMCMVANRFVGVRATVVVSVEDVVRARAHGDANCLCVAGDAIGAETLPAMLDAFVATAPSAEDRHVLRREQVAHLDAVLGEPDALWRWLVAHTD